MPVINVSDETFATILQFARGAGLSVEAAMVHGLRASAPGGRQELLEAIRGLYRDATVLALTAEAVTRLRVALERYEDADDPEESTNASFKIHPFAPGAYHGIKLFTVQPLDNESPFAMLGSDWGPWEWRALGPSTTEDAMNDLRFWYLGKHPKPPPEPIIGPSVWELLRRPL